MTNHLTTATAIYEAFGRGDIPTILSHMADDIKWEQWADNTAQQAGVPWLQARHGKAGPRIFSSAGQHGNQRISGVIDHGRWQSSRR